MEEKLWVRLPSRYTRKDLPLDNRNTTTEEKAKNGNIWTISGLLIGENYYRALEPREVISSQNSCPYAFKTRLVWCCGSYE